jgi:hypothetical protein
MAIVKRYAAAAKKKKVLGSSPPFQKGRVVMCVGERRARRTVRVSRPALTAYQDMPGVQNTRDAHETKVKRKIP